MGGSKRQYTKELLLECMARDSSILVGEYEPINSISRIEFQCTCGTNVSKSFRSIVCDGGCFCKKCTIENAKTKRVNTVKKRFGVESVLQNQDVMNRLKQTNLEKYGTEYALSSKDVIEKRTNTNIEKYGVKNPSQNAEIASKMRETHLKKSPKVQEQILEKRRQTNRKKYGVDWTMQDPEIRSKIKQTVYEKYGVDNLSQSPTIRKKMIENSIRKYGINSPQKLEQVKLKVKNTCLLKYGGNGPTSSKRVRDKIVQTNIERYGVENAMQNVTVQERAEKRAKRFKKYTMPNGEVRNVQGYEPFALDELMQEYTSEQVLTSRADVPKIEYEYLEKHRVYFPDIFIPHENRIIEVKSTWTYAQKQDAIYQKANSCTKKGYLFEIWMYDGKKNKTIIKSLLDS